MAPTSTVQEVGSLMLQGQCWVLKVVKLCF